MAEPKYFDEQGGAVNPIGSMLPPGLGGILNQFDMNPDKMLLNRVMGNPFAYQQAHMGGRGTSAADILMAQQQKEYFKYNNDAQEQHKRDILRGGFGIAGFGDSSMRKAENAMSVFNPVGMAASLAMLSYGDAGANRALTRGFQGMNMYAPGIRTGPSDITSKADQALMNGFATQMKSDFYANPNQYGGNNLQGAGEVFQQLSQRSVLGQGDISPGKIKATSKKVQEMSQAVGAMQDLFGGTIPEIFDKMDAIFGGNAGAMGGQALQNRVLRLKQTSQITGQSLQATAQMMMTGAKYAEAAGMDAGIGAAAAEQTGLALGVNVAGTGNQRRVNSGRLRAATLRANASASTSRQAQYYAGALQVWKENNPGGTSDQFQEKVQGAGATSIGDLAAVAGGSVSAVQTASGSDAANIAMSDDRNVSRYAVEQRSRQAQLATANSIRSAVNRQTGRNLDLDFYMNKNGSMKTRDDVVGALVGKGLSRSQASGMVDIQMNSAAQAILGAGANSQELQNYFTQQEDAGKIRTVRDARAKAEAAIGMKSGGIMGVLNFLSEGADAKKSGAIADVLSAGLGVMTPAELKAAGLTKENTEDRMTRAASSLRSAYTSALESGDKVLAGRIQTTIKGMMDGRLIKASKEDRAEVLKRIGDGTLSAEDVAFTAKVVGTDKQRRVEEMLAEGGATAEAYITAINSGDKGGGKAAGRKLALEKALSVLGKGEGGNALRKKIQEGAYDSIEAAKKDLTDLEFGDKSAKDAYFEEARRNVEALGAGDPALKLNDILVKLTEVLVTLSNKQDKTKGDRKE